MAGTGTMVALVTSPLYHVNGFSFVTPELLAGTRVFVMEKFDAALAVELIEKHHITYTVMVPTMLQRIARLPGLRAEQLASINRLIYGGSTIPEWLVDRWLELIPPEAFIFTYGSTERLGTHVDDGRRVAGSPRRHRPPARCRSENPRRPRQ
jgi:bile acid-coenzyme A ligase